jgi:glucokinase-like ROK family protein
MREVNRSIVLDLIRTTGPLSRTAIARATALAKPTVSGIVEDLLDGGLVHEVGTGGSTVRGGRPPSLVAYNEAATAYVGIDFGVHTTNVAVADGLGRIVSTQSAPSISNAPKRAITQVRRLAAKALADAGIDAARVQAVGAAVPGTVDRATGACVLAPNLGWRDAPIRDWLAEGFGVPASVHNVTQAAAFAEGLAGAARGVREFVWVYAGTGVGAGIVVDGRIFPGRQGFAGELGHCPVADDGPPCNCGRTGCLETLASGPALVRAVASRTAPGASAPEDASAVIHAALDGDPVASGAVRDVGEYLGRGIAYLLNLLNPELIVLGGPLAEAGDLLLSAVRGSLHRHALDATQVDVVRSELGAQAELIGAVLLGVGLEASSHRIVSSGFHPGS